MLQKIKWAREGKRTRSSSGSLQTARDTTGFADGTQVPASASPHVVGKWAIEAAVDPEEMLVASLSSCHMLSFLHLARMAGFTITAYEDQRAGMTAGLAPGRLAVTQGQASAENRVGGRGAREGGARSPAPPGARNLLHREFGEDARSPWSSGSPFGRAPEAPRARRSGGGGLSGPHPTAQSRGAGELPLAPSSRGRSFRPLSTPCRCCCRSGCSPADLAVERASAPNLEERLALARSRRSTRVVLIQKMPWRRFAQLRSDKTVVLPVGRAARGRRKQEGGDDYRFCHGLTLANEEASAPEIALICLGFKRPTRSNFVEAHWPFQHIGQWL